MPRLGGVYAARKDKTNQKRDPRTYLKVGPAKVRVKLDEPFEKAIRRFRKKANAGSTGFKNQSAVSKRRAKQRIEKAQRRRERHPWPTGY